MTCGYRDVHLEIHSTIEALDLVQAVTEHIGRRLGFDDESLHWTAIAAAWHSQCLAAKPEPLLGRRRVSELAE